MSGLDITIFVCFYGRNSMCSTVKDLLALPELRECYLLNPGVSCKQTVKSVTIMDNPNILKWLSGYEVLLSNGYSLVNFQNREWKQFIAGLVKKNVAALFIKLSYFVDQLPEETIRYTVEQGDTGKGGTAGPKSIRNLSADHLRIFK